MSKLRTNPGDRAMMDIVNLPGLGLVWEQTSRYACEDVSRRFN